MAKEVRAQISSGKPIIFDFRVEDCEIAYETRCPNCGSKDFVISLDKSRITCNQVKCLSTLFVRRFLKDAEADFEGIGWAL